MDMPEFLARRAREFSSNVEYLTRESKIVDSSPGAASLSGTFQKQELETGITYLKLNLSSLEEKARALSVGSTCVEQATTKAEDLILAQLLPAVPPCEPPSCGHLSLQRQLVTCVREADACLAALRGQLAQAQASAAREQARLEDTRVLHAGLQAKVQQRGLSRNHGRADGGSGKHRGGHGSTPTQVMEAHAERLAHDNEQLTAQLARFVEQFSAQLEGVPTDVDASDAEDGQLLLTEGAPGEDASASPTPSSSRKLHGRSTDKAGPRQRRAHDPELASSAAATQRHGLVQLITDLMSACFDSKPPSSMARPRGIPRTRYRQGHVELLLRAGVATTVLEDSGRIQLTRYHE